MITPRQCYWIPPDAGTDNGFVPSLVTEGEPGHAPLRGRGRLATPWYWGATYEEALAHCVKANRDDFNLTEEDTAVILASSISAQLRR